MSFPSIPKTIDLLGYRMKDKITGVTGVVTSVSFDLYGCVQATLHQGTDKDGKMHEQFWFDIARLTHVDHRRRVMARPVFGETEPAHYDHGPAAKPVPRAV